MYNPKMRRETNMHVFLNFFALSLHPCCYLVNCGKVGSTKRCRTPQSHPVPHERIETKSHAYIYKKTRHDKVQTQTHRILLHHSMLRPLHCMVIPEQQSVRPCITTLLLHTERLHVHIQKLKTYLSHHREVLIVDTVNNK